MEILLYSTIIFLFIQLAVDIVVLRACTKIAKFKDRSWLSAGIALISSFLVFAIISLPILWFDISDVASDVLDAVLLFVALLIAIRFVYGESWRKAGYAAAVVCIVATLMIFIGGYLYSLTPPGL